MVRPARTRKYGGEKGKLDEYRRRRSFERSEEPGGLESVEAREHPVFVVQVHDASSIHFDFRLEADGVLKSWAVPKGPSTDPHVKRLAMPTEDHPMAYRSFEGVIPQGEYGGGTAMVWDEGTYRNLTKSRTGKEIPLDQALAKGHASFRLEGCKLRGAYALTRLRRSGDEAWLLVKKSDRHAKADRAADPRRLRSVRSGRTLRRVAAEAARGTGRGGGRR